MKIEYDVPLPKSESQDTRARELFDEFRESSHETACVEYDTMQEAVNAAKAICMYIKRGGITDAYAMRRREKIFFVKVPKEVKSGL